MWWETLSAIAAEKAWYSIGWRSTELVWVNHLLLPPKPQREVFAR